eukprot:8151496-Pyramimonas_sp.AAC.1
MAIYHLELRASDVAVCTLAALRPHQVPLMKIRFVGNGWFTSLIADKCTHGPGAHDNAPVFLSDDTLEKFLVYDTIGGGDALPPSPACPIHLPIPSLLPPP